MKTAEQIISVELLSNTIDRTELILLDRIKLNNSLKYHSEAFNQSIKENINWMSEVLQKVVDKYYFDYYEVNNYIEMNLDNLEYTLEHNLSIVNSCKKLVKFINI